MSRSELRKPIAPLIASLIVALSLAAACGEAATNPPEEEESAAPTTAPATAATPSMVEPAGEMSLAWHAGLSSSWLDPQDNPAMATPYNFAYALHDAVVKIIPQNLNTPSLAES